MRPLTILHTSDWHLGHQLYRKRRDQEFASFLDWLCQTLQEKHVDVLIVAGDIFDTGTPGATAQALYFSFLGKIASLGVRHVIVTAGNHDSPAFLSASAPVLKNLNIHVSSASTENIEDEIIILKDASEKAELIVCAVPFLRENDVSQFRAGDSYEERNSRLLEGLKNHFGRLGELAAQKREELGLAIPIIATAHLFTAEVDPENDSARQIYRGNLGCMPLVHFPASFDYVALGHIHRPCAINGNDTRRYSGSPLPMTFAEARYNKEIVLLQWDGHSLQVQPLKVPFFRNLKTVTGNSEKILAELQELIDECDQKDQETWLEIQHDGTDSILGLPTACEDLVKNTNLEILCIKTSGKTEAPEALELDHGLDELDPLEMFTRYLAHEKIPEKEWSELTEDFKDLMQKYYEGSEKCEF